MTLRTKPEKSSYLPALCKQSAVFFEKKFFNKKINGKYDKKPIGKIVNNNVMKKLFVIFFIIIAAAFFIQLRHNKMLISTGSML